VSNLLLSHSLLALSPTLKCTKLWAEFIQTRGINKQVNFSVLFWHKEADSYKLANCNICCCNVITLVSLVHCLDIYKHSIAKTYYTTMVSINAKLNLNCISYIKKVPFCTLPLVNLSHLSLSHFLTLSSPHLPL
jgi:hypothetical protein